ncbi:hypothetical protein BC833DRAFT_652574 [Globomyces pollinis-pini]|nr:hypothetical protein BC833DRAFT_652574 [Globomyces pollinis-pini]
MNNLNITTDSRRASLLSIPEYNIIYEVNLSVPRANSLGYLNWLQDFTQQNVETIEGFTHAVVYTVPKPEGLHWLSEEGEDKCYFSVHYHVESQQHLEDYLAKHQERIAGAEQDRWLHICTSRRILKLQSTTTPKPL